MSAALPPRLGEIVEDFALCEGREKLELLLEYAESLPPLPEHLVGRLADMESVPECMTPVSVAAEQSGSGLVFHFAVPAESPTVRGFASIMAQGLQDSAAENVLAIPADFYLAMGLQDVLTAQRMNGMSAILAHVKRQAARFLAK